MDLEIYINKLNIAVSDYSSFIHNILSKREAYVLAIPKRRISLSGTDANDQKITPLYAQSTIKKKQKKVKEQGTLL